MLRFECLQEQEVKSVVLQAPWAGYEGLEPVHFESAKEHYGEGFGWLVWAVRRDCAEKCAQGQDLGLAKRRSFC